MPARRCATMGAAMRGPPFDRRGPVRWPADRGPDRKKLPPKSTPETTLLAMADRLVDDSIGRTPVRTKIAACRVADRLRRGQAVTSAEIGTVRRLYYLRRAELLAAAETFAGSS